MAATDKKFEAAAKDGQATAHVCRSFACELPVTTAQALAARLDAPPGG